MAEVIAALGILASIAQLADYGFKLSIKLYTFSSAVSTADTSIRSISNDVSLTSSVLQELCRIIKSDDEHVVSETAIEATKQTVKECLKIFEELDKALEKSLGNLGKGGVPEDGKKRVNRGTVMLERLKWPFKQPKMELLRSNLDRLKASLTLMLQVSTLILCHQRWDVTIISGAAYASRHLRIMSPHSCFLFLASPQSLIFTFITSPSDF